MLWVCIVLNPRATNAERMQWKALLEKWSKNEVCPQEDPDFRAQGRPDNVSHSSEFLKEEHLHNYFLSFFLVSGTITSNT